MKVIILLLFLKSLSVFGQGGEEEYLVSNRVVDTSYYNSEMIYVFEDRSWDFASEYMTFEKMESNITDGMLDLQEDQLYKKNWKNNLTFSLVYNLRNVVDSVTIDLKDYVKPIDVTMNSGFKLRWGRWHKGNDFAAPIGTSVKASWGGKVRYAEYNHGGYGKMIIIRHPNGLETAYAHLSKINVSVNEYVNAGEVIGAVGNTGHSTGPHLHYEVRLLDNPIDPKLIYNSSKLIVEKNIFKTTTSGGSDLFLKEIFGINKGGVFVKTPPKKTRRKTASNMN